MQIGLKNRLTVISLFPIFILITLASYYLYDSYNNYQKAELIHNKLSENTQLNDIIGNIARERGMTAMYIGDSSKATFQSLSIQRNIVNNKINLYVNDSKYNKALHAHKTGKENCIGCINIKSIENILFRLKDVRKLVDDKNIKFDKAFTVIYSGIQKELITKLEKLIQNQTDQHINELFTIYIEMVDAKEYSGIERGFMSYIISRGLAPTKKDLKRWISVVGKADVLSYKTLHNPELLSKLDALFESKESIELYEKINAERATIVDSSKSTKYNASAIKWFAMHSEKINIISNAEDLILQEMDKRAVKVKETALQILSLTVSLWLISVILAFLGYFLSSEITKNIKNLEEVLKRVAEDAASEDEEITVINLHTAEGTTQAYNLLERIIEQTREDKESAQEASEAKSMFLANMSHEIRTPLNGIVGFTELLKDTNLGEEQTEFVEIIEKSSENLLEIINNILDLSKIESNKLEIEDIVFNPISEFESAVEVYAVRASEKHIDLGCFIDPKLENPLKGDPTKIKEVIINLLSNAVKFTSSSGSINVDIRVIESDQEGQTRIRFEVQDSGIGVTNEQKAKIFEAFSQADTSITRKYGGTGLGLTISSRFIELMGGELDLHSEAGDGTTFFFSIDFERVETLNESSQGIYSNLNALVLKNSHKAKRQDIYLKEYLDFYGVRYTAFENIDELETLQRQVNYDLVFIDYDYTQENLLLQYSNLPQALVLLTKTYFMKKVDSLNLDIFKTIYEPLNISKVKQTLENYSSEGFESKKSTHKKFNKKTSRFQANVLIAEDNIINQKLIKRTLEDIGLNVDIANNGLEAFQKRKDGNYDLIFMDIQMPILDGVEATAEILEYEEDYNQAHIPIIALTANALKGDRERFLEAGLDEYTTKPLIRPEIISLLNHFLADFIVDNTQKILEIEEPKQAPKKVKVAKKKTYKADILLAKEHKFESRLYVQLLKTIGYSYELAQSAQELSELTKVNSYKLVIFDIGLEGLKVEKLSNDIKRTSEEKALSSALILISREEEHMHTQYVDETIINVVNKHSLRKIFEKFI
ncbi:response regulator [Sulfurimonas sp.]|uniref:response regulator n=1 Tax=Sulfurimonas sp. TaxID=2022749 RepID=UPI002B4A147E|nr:response regulator [Sulfurimonas sp.]